MDAVADDHGHAASKDGGGEAARPAVSGEGPAEGCGGHRGVVGHVPPVARKAAADDDVGAFIASRGAEDGLPY
eukprot:909737-Prymnesium_polylepis.1